MTEPTTEAGRRLLRQMDEDGWSSAATDGALALVLAIEAEAREGWMPETDCVDSPWQAEARASLDVEVLAELESWASTHAAVVAGRANADDVRGFIAWYRAILAEAERPEKHKHGPLSWRDRADSLGRTGWACDVCGAFPVAINR